MYLPRELSLRHSTAQRPLCCLLWLQLLLMIVAEALRRNETPLNH